MSMSQPETELGEEVSLNEDDAVLEQLARKREQPTEEGEEVGQEEVAQAEESEETEESTAEEVEEDPEYDLGELKAKKSQILAWKQGEMKDADYRQKTAAAAEANRQAQALQERVEQERTHYANHLDALIGQLQTELVGDQQTLAELAATDPAEWVRQNAIQQQKIQRFQQALGERQVIEQRATEERERKQNDRVRQSSEALHAALPEWRDEAVKTKELGEMESFLRQQGLSDEDIPTFLNHKVYLIARKAWQAEKREAARLAAKDKQVKQQPPKPLKAGAATTTETQASDAYKDAQKRARSGKEEDLMALLAAKRRNA